MPWFAPGEFAAESEEMRDKWMKQLSLARKGRDGETGLENRNTSWS